MVRLSDGPFAALLVLLESPEVGEFRRSQKILRSRLAIDACLAMWIRWLGIVSRLVQMHEGAKQAIAWADRAGLGYLAAAAECEKSCLSDV